MIWCALLTLLVSRRLFNLWRNLNPVLRLRFTSLRCAKTFNRISIAFMQVVLESNGVELTPDIMMEVASFDLSDTHVNRKRIGDGFWA